MFLGIAAFILGLRGLAKVKRNPEVKGKVHAWVAVICGALFGFGYLALTALLVGAAVLSK